MAGLLREQLPRVARTVDEDELIEHWMLIGDELGHVADSAIYLEHADGLTMNGRLALPEGIGQRPGVLIAHESNGLDEFQRSRPERLAELGYVAFALNSTAVGMSTPIRSRCWHAWARSARIWIMFRRWAALGLRCSPCKLVQIRRSWPRSVTASAAPWYLSWPEVVPISRRSSAFTLA